ncbi:MAG: secretion protein HlyD [Moraxellaceae bacterium]|jgi:RND family efflux transporter MFP subunit|nr:secretion protein HlyD [Moraxellaceae bacterium]
MRTSLNYLLAIGIGLLPVPMLAAPPLPASPAAVPAKRPLPAPRVPRTPGGADIGWSCLLEPSSRVEVATEVQGVLDAVLVERGALVKRGAVLARMRSGLEEASVTLARAKADFGTRKSTRNEELFAEEMISTHEKDELQTEAMIAKLELRESEERLRMRQILSPVDGIVVERHKSAGEYVGNEPVFTVVRVDPLHVEVVAPASRYGTIRKGMVADVRPEQPVGGSFKARVSIVDPVIDAASGTFGVRLTLPNPGNALPAGLKCQVSFEGAP